MLNTRPLEFADFSGGLTDDYLSANPTQFQRADNLLVDDDKKLFYRPGSRLFDENFPKVPGDYTGFLTNFMQDQALLAQGGQSIYRYTPTGWTELEGPTGNPAFSPAISAVRSSSFQWKGHLFITHDGGADTQKIYRDGDGVYQLRTAGLPPVPENDNFSPLSLAKSIALANELRTKLLAHFAKLTQHVLADTVAAALVTAPAATDTPSLLTLVTALTAAYTSHINDQRISSKYHRKETDNSSTVAQAIIADQTLTLTEPPEDLVEAVAILNDLKSSFITHDGNDDIHNHVTNANPLVASFVFGVDRGPVIAQNLQKVYDYANLLKTKFNTHAGDGGTATTAHSKLPDATNIVTAPNAVSPETLEVLVWDLRFKYTGHDNDAELPVTIFHAATEASDHSLTPKATNPVASPFPDYLGGARAGNLPALVTQLNAIKTQYNAHVNDLTSHYTTNPTVYLTNLVPGVDVLLGDYLYGFVYFYEYTVGKETFQDFGSVLIKAAINIIDIGQEAAQISNLPVLANGTLTNYDTANIKIKIYRTTKNGTAFYFAGEVANGVTTFSDSVTDAELATRERLYTAGGVPDNDPPPIAKYIHQVGGFAYYGNIQDGDEVLPNRIRQSQAEDLDSCPQTFFVDLPEENRGVSSARGVPVVWTESGTFRLEGVFDERGGGSIRAVAISDEVGLSGSGSPIQFEGGLLFAGTDGFYFTDAYKVIKISNGWNKTYAKLAHEKITGVYDRPQNRVWWGAGDSCFILDLDFNIQGNACFTTASNGVNFKPSALCVFNDKLLRADSRGYVFVHDVDYMQDPRIDDLAAPNTWAKSPYIFDYVSPALDFGTTMLRQWVTKVTTKLKNRGNISLQIVSNSDDGRVVRSLTPIRYRGNLVWGDPEIIWGDPEIVWAPKGLVHEERRMPSGAMRSSNRQVRFTNANVVIEGSDKVDVATVDFVAKTLTLVSGEFQQEAVGHVIVFPTEETTLQFEITAQAPGVLNFADPDNLCPPDGTYAWEVRGVPKNEAFHMLSYCLHYDVLGQTTKNAAGESGANA